MKRLGAIPITADGPFAEAREPLGGYYLIEAGHPSAAIELAALLASPFPALASRR